MHEVSDNCLNNQLHKICTMHIDMSLVIEVKYYSSTFVALFDN